jgi:hypothetical protein
MPIMIRRTPHGHALTLKEKIAGKWKQTQLMQIGWHVSVDGYAAAILDEFPRIRRERRKLLREVEDPENRGKAYWWYDIRRKEARDLGIEAFDLLDKLEAVKGYIGQGIVKGGEEAPDVGDNLLQRVERVLAQDNRVWTAETVKGMSRR